MSDTERNEKPEPGGHEAPRRGGPTRRRHRFNWPSIGVAVFVAAAGLSVLGLVSVPGISVASARIAVAVIAVGLLLRLPSGEAKGSRSDLGAAVLGGAVVAFGFSPLRISAKKRPTILPSARTSSSRSRANRISMESNSKARTSATWCSSRSTSAPPASAQQTSATGPSSARASSARTLADADLTGGARHDGHTQWPQGFEPQAAGQCCSGPKRRRPRAVVVREA